MQKTIYSLFVWSLWIGHSLTTQAQTTVLSLQDLAPLVGQWYGSLTYLDYTSNQAYTMPADVQIKLVDSPPQLVVAYAYPNEPKANGTDTLVLSADGRMLDNEMVVSLAVTLGGEKTIITEAKGKDGNDDKPAILRHIYTFSATLFSIRKEVLFDGETQWIKRHTYSFARSKSDK